MLENWPYSLLILKRKTEDIFIYPFILVGRMLAFFKPLGKEYQIYYFFPFYHIGGAEKVHLQIAQAAGGPNCILFFTRRSHNDHFYKEFERSGCVIKDISAFTDNKWLYFLNLVYRGIITAYINRQQVNPVVFNGQCNFGYKISPWVKKGILQIELIHSFNSFSYIRMPFLPFITKTIMISRKRIEDHLVFYTKTGVPDKFREKIRYISNAIPLPDISAPKTTDKLVVLYVGRGGLEKRVYLIAEMARQFAASHAAVQFEMLGDVSEILGSTQFPFIKFYGNLSDKEVIESIYAKASVLMITSDTEGFPMVVIEAMAAGCAIIATPVGDIPFHIKNGENGFLFSSITDEEKIVKEGVEYISKLRNEQELLKTIGEKNQRYAQENFGIKHFNEQYRDIMGISNHNN